MQLELYALDLSSSQNIAALVASWIYPAGLSEVQYLGMFVRSRDRLCALVSAVASQLERVLAGRNGHDRSVD